ncbi:hypothetical protein V7146_16225 [Gottfriedia acidiceleris]|uniref:hypothetical protein n=1 Tax=Gottfriedia acidiceleris TaxID=371036 RepID=UPI002FFE09E8
MLKKEPEKLVFLRHRFSRLIDMATAYQVFRTQEVEIGKDKIIQNPIVTGQVAQTLMIQLYSYLYSIFDYHPQWNSVDFISITDNLREDFDTDTIKIHDKVKDLWQQIKLPLKVLRNKVGFHQEDNEEGVNEGYGQLNAIHPLLPLLLIQYLRVFFRSMDFIYERKEGMLTPGTRIELEKLRSMVEEYEQYILDQSTDLDLSELI